MRQGRQDLAEVGEQRTLVGGRHVREVFGDDRHAHGGQGRRILQLEPHIGRDRAVLLEAIESLERLAVLLGVAEVGPVDRVGRRAIGEPQLNDRRSALGRRDRRTAADLFELRHLPELADLEVDPVVALTGLPVGHAAHPVWNPRADLAHHRFGVRQVH